MKNIEGENQIGESSGERTKSPEQSEKDELFEVLRARGKKTPKIPIKVGEQPPSITVGTSIVPPEVREEKPTEIPVSELDKALGKTIRESKLGLLPEQYRNVINQLNSEVLEEMGKSYGAILLDKKLEEYLWARVASMLREREDFVEIYKEIENLEKPKEQVTTLKAKDASKNEVEFRVGDTVYLVLDFGDKVGTIVTHKIEEIDADIGFIKTEFAELPAKSFFTNQADAEAKAKEIRDALEAGKETEKVPGTEGEAEKEEELPEAELYEDFRQANNAWDEAFKAFKESKKARGENEQTTKELEVKNQKASDEFNRIEKKVYSSNTELGLAYKAYQEKERFHEEARKAKNPDPMVIGQRKKEEDKAWNTYYNLKKKILHPKVEAPEIRPSPSEPGDALKAEKTEKPVQTLRALDASGEEVIFKVGNEAHIIDGHTGEIHSYKIEAIDPKEGVMINGAYRNLKEWYTNRATAEREAQKIKDTLEAEKETKREFKEAPPKFKVGDLVQWTLGGVDQFTEGKKIMYNLGIMVGRRYYGVEDGTTGIPEDELKLFLLKEEFEVSEEYEGEKYEELKKKCDPLRKYLTEVVKLSQEEIENIHFKYHLGIGRETKEGITSGYEEEFFNYHDFLTTLNKLTPEQRRLLGRGYTDSKGNKQKNPRITADKNFVDKIFPALPPEQQEKFKAIALDCGQGKLPDEFLLEVKRIEESRKRLEEMKLKRLLNEAKVKKSLGIKPQDVIDKALEQVKFAESGEVAKEFNAEILTLIDSLVKEKEMIPEVRKVAVDTLITMTGLDREAIEAVLANQQNIISDLALQRESQGKSFWKSIRGSLARMGGYGGAGFLLGATIGTGGIGVGLAAGLGAVRIAERYYTEKKSLNRIAKFKNEIKGKIARAGTDEEKGLKGLLFQDIVVELATAKQRQIDGKDKKDKDLTTDLAQAEKNYIKKRGPEEYNAYQRLLKDQADSYLNDINKKLEEENIPIEMHNKIIDQISALIKMDISNTLLETKIIGENQTLFNRFKESKLSKVLSAFTGGGKTIQEKVVNAGVFTGMGVLARSIPVLRNILMGVAGWRLGETIGGAVASKIAKIGGETLPEIKADAFEREGIPEDQQDKMLSRARVQLADPKFKAREPSEYAKLKEKVDGLLEEKIKKADDALNFVGYIHEQSKDMLKRKMRDEKFIKAYKILGGTAGAIIGGIFVADFLKDWRVSKKEAVQPSAPRIIEEPSGKPPLFPLHTPRPTTIPETEFTNIGAEASSHTPTPTKIPTEIPATPGKTVIETPSVSAAIVDSGNEVFDRTFSQTVRELESKIGDYDLNFKGVPASELMSKQFAWVPVNYGGRVVGELHIVTRNLKDLEVLGYTTPKGDEMIFTTPIKASQLGGDLYRQGGGLNTLDAWFGKNPVPMDSRKVEVVSNVGGLLAREAPPAEVTPVPTQPEIPPSMPTREAPGIGTIKATIETGVPKGTPIPEKVPTIEVKPFKIALGEKGLAPYGEQALLVKALDEVHTEGPTLTMAEQAKALNMAANLRELIFEKHNVLGINANEVRQNIVSFDESTNQILIKDPKGFDQLVGTLTEHANNLESSGELMKHIPAYVDHIKEDTMKDLVNKHFELEAGAPKAPEITTIERNLDVIKGAQELVYKKELSAILSEKPVDLGGYKLDLGSVTASHVINETNAWVPVNAPTGAGEAAAKVGEVHIVYNQSHHQWEAVGYRTGGGGGGGGVGPEEKLPEPVEVSKLGAGGDDKVNELEEWFGPSQRPGVEAELLGKAEMEKLTSSLSLGTGETLLGEVPNNKLPISLPSGFKMRGIDVDFEKKVYERYSEIDAIPLGTAGREEKVEEFSKLLKFMHSRGDVPEGSPKKYVIFTEEVSGVNKFGEYEGDQHEALTKFYKEYIPKEITRNYTDQYFNEGNLQKNIKINFYGKDIIEADLGNNYKLHILPEEGMVTGMAKGTSHIESFKKPIKLSELLEKLGLTISDAEQKSK